MRQHFFKESMNQAFSVLLTGLVSLLPCQNLADDLDSELSGNFQKVVMGLLMLAPVYDAYELRNSIKVGMILYCPTCRPFSQTCCWRTNLGVAHNTNYRPASFVYQATQKGRWSMVNL